MSKALCFYTAREHQTEKVRWVVVLLWFTVLRVKGYVLKIASKKSLLNACLKGLDFQAVYANDTHAKSTEMERFDISSWVKSISMILLCDIITELQKAQKSKVDTLPVV